MEDDLKKIKFEDDTKKKENNLKKEIKKREDDLKKKKKEDDLKKIIYSQFLLNLGPNLSCGWLSSLSFFLFFCCCLKQIDFHQKFKISDLGF